MNKTGQGQSIVMDTPDQIDFAVLAARKGALKMECLGLKRRGRSAYSICKEAYGLKGSKQKVLEQMQAMVDKAIADKEAEAMGQADGEVVAPVHTLN
jgi:hypothetical protein